MPNNTKPLTLPSGATCTIHAPSRFIDMKAGYPPQSLQRLTLKQITEGQPAIEAVPADPDKGTSAIAARAVIEPRALTDLEIDYLVRSESVKLVGCTSPIRRPDGSTVRLVDKPFWELKPGELPLVDLSQADAQMLSDEINALREEAVADATTFRGNGTPPAQDPAQPGPDGETLRDAPEHAGAAAGG